MGKGSSRERAGAEAALMKKTKKRDWVRSQADDPKGDRRNAVAAMSEQRQEARRRIRNRKYHAELDPTTRRPKR